jgi:hypothetical protein
MSQRSNKPVLKEVPDVVQGKMNYKPVLFKRGKFLGKGGFARCYELISERDRIIFAGKVISKQILIKKSQKEKVYFKNIQRLLTFAFRSCKKFKSTPN